MAHIIARGTHLIPTALHPATKIASEPCAATALHTIAILPGTHHSCCIAVISAADGLGSLIVVAGQEAFRVNATCSSGIGVVVSGAIVITTVRDAICDHSGGEYEEDDSS